MVVVAQLVRALVCGTRGRGFETHLPPKGDTFKVSPFFMKFPSIARIKKYCIFVSKVSSFMKKIILCLFLPLSLFFYSCNNGQREKVHASLENWNKVIYKQPAAVRDSLNKIKSVKMFPGDAAYHSLLYTIASERLDSLPKDDSLISTSVTWYKRNKDYYNLCRSLLYKGIVLYNHSRVDSSAYESVINAEEIYQTKKIQDLHTGSLIYMYLGRILRQKDDSTQAISYFRKSLALSTELNSKVDIQKVRLDLFYEYLSRYKYAEALSNILIFEDTRNLSPSMEYDLYHAMYSYYMSKREYNIAIVYANKMLKLKDLRNLDVNESKLYNSQAFIFKKLHNLDSTLYYAKLCVNTIKDSLAKENHYYYRFLADTYSSSGDHENAELYYRKAYLSYIKAYAKIARDRVMEVRRKYDVSLKKEAEMSKIKVQIIIMICLAILLVFVAFLSLMFTRIWKRMKNQMEIVSTVERQKYCAEAELKKAWFLNELLKASASLLPQFVENINKEAARDRKISKEISENLNSAIDNVRAMSRNKMTAITKNDNFRSLNPNLDYLPDLSDLEKIILLLMDYNFSVQEISDLINSSPSSIRSIKTKIKEKILATEGLPFDPKTAFSILK